jgi:class 3 adenylate cyclase/tetratricopeptide (TPR) repeat protein
VAVEIRLCGGVDVLHDGVSVPEALLAGRQGRLVLAYLACERGRAVPREELAELLWPQQLPASWTTSLSAVISRLRRLLTEAGLDGTAALASVLPNAYRLDLPDDAALDWEDAQRAVAAAEDAVAVGDGPHALELAAVAATVAARGFFADESEWVDEQRDAVRDVAVRAALARSDAFILTDAPARAVDAAREALALDGRREASFRALMRSHSAAGERAEALRVWERCRATLVDELGVDPSPETEEVYLALLGGTSDDASATMRLPSGVVTFLLTDIVDSSALWDRHPAAMAAALERHDAIVAEVVSRSGGELLKSKLEGDATVSVFERATAGAAAALALRDAFAQQEWPDDAEPHVRMALHTGEAYERAGDYFGPALNRAARLRALARADQILLSQAAAELVRDRMPGDAVLVDRGHRDLRGLSRGENVYELLARRDADAEPATDVDLPNALRADGPFVGRAEELAQLARAWEKAVAGVPGAVLIGGEPGVGKSRLAAEHARRCLEMGALVLYGRCDEDLDVPYQPFLDAVRAAAPVLGPRRLRDVRGVDELIRVVPELADLVPGASAATRADPDTERHALFNAVTQLLVATSTDIPVVLVLDDLHWAGKATLTLLRRVLRDAGHARVHLVGTYRDTELSRTHPLAATIADLRGDGVATRLPLTGLPEDDVVSYVTQAGVDDRALGRELARITAGNPFFLIATLQHISDAGGSWHPDSLPEGVKEATGRRLARLSEGANDALSIAAVAGSKFDLDVIEAVHGGDLVDAIDEARRAGIVFEEPGAPGTFVFAHAIVRQVLLAELVTVRRVRLHRAIAELLETYALTAGGPHLIDLAHHWFECASAGGADRAVDACGRAAEYAVERLAFEEAADLYGMAIAALDLVEEPNADTLASLHLGRCDALLAAGEVVTARGALDVLARVAKRSPRLAAWHTIFAGQLAVLAQPDQMAEVVDEVGKAAEVLRDLDDVVGHAKAEYVHALALERLGRLGEAERALDVALSAARRAGDRRLADAILAEVPFPAVWGPSPVTRASGRCLDVVRVCRITEGGAAVESVAVRSQAVLEGMRGRFDAARRMIASSRRTAEQLGLAHHRRETDIAAGVIELFAHEWAAAEVPLRRAWDELRAHGLGGDAGRAGGLLARAVRMLDRLDEAEAIVQEASALGGDDMRASIAWRGVAAEIAAIRGDHARALQIARDAVALAAPTDALIQLANARISLGAVLYIVGEPEAAAREMQLAREVCDAKGATALAAVAGGAPLEAEVAPLRAPWKGGVHANTATRIAQNMLEAVNRNDYAAVMASYAGDVLLEDRRRHRRSFLGAERSAQAVTEEFLPLQGDVPFEVYATRGEHLVLGRGGFYTDEFTVDMLGIMVTDDTKVVHGIWFDPDDTDAAFAELDRLYLAGDGAPHAGVVGRFAEFITKVNAGDWTAARQFLADDYVLEDHRTIGYGEMDVHELADNFDALRNAGRRRRMRVEHIPAVSDAALVMVSVEVGDVAQDTGRFEHRQINVMSHDGRVFHGQDIYAEDELGLAMIRFRELSGEWNLAVRVYLDAIAAWNRGEWEGFAVHIAPDVESIDNRRFTQVAGYDHVMDLRALFDLTESTIRLEEIVATRGEKLAVVAITFVFRDQNAGDADLDALGVFEIDDAGLWTRVAIFDRDDVAGALAELAAREAALS